MLLALAHTVTLVLIGRIVGGILAATHATAAAYMADISTPEEKGRNFGLIGAAFGVGFVLGPVLGSLASTIDLRAPFWIAGGLAFAFTGGIGAALSLGARRGGLLTAVIVLPLFVPPVIFGGGALDAFAVGLPWRAGFALLTAYAAAAVALGPLAMAAACRNALS